MTIERLEELRKQSVRCHGNQKCWIRPLELEELCLAARVLLKINECVRGGATSSAWLRETLEAVESSFPSVKL